MRKLTILTIGAFCIALLTGCSRKQTGPEISRYSDIYKVGDQWYCPLCNEPVRNGDRSQIDPALYLSEWHDVFLDSSYFDEKINHISDAELVASLSLPTGLGTPADSAAGGRAAVEKIIRYFAERPDNRRLYHYDRAAKIPLLTIDSFLQQVDKDPTRRDLILRAASAIAQPDSGYTIGGVRFGWQVDFNYDWKERSQFAIHYLPFFTDLLNAYLVSGDPFYAKSFEDLFNQWYDQKDQVQHHMKPGETKHRDIIWYELGLGVRLPRLIDSYRVYRSRLAPETQKRLLKTVLGSARWLYQGLTRVPFHPYNWQTQTAMTLAYVALHFPEFTEARQWLEASRENMELHFKRDILADGGYIERTGSYTRFVFGMFYRYMLLFKYYLGDTSLLDAYLPRLEKMMEFTALTLTPIGVNSPINDASRGTALADLLVEMGEFFQRGDFVGAVRHRLTPKKLRSLSVVPRPPDRTSVNFEFSQFAVMRDAWQPDAYFMIINYGPFQNHGHYDILDFEIFANGVPIAVDAGIGLAGYSDPLHVSWYKQSRAHNMLTVDDAITNKRGIAGEDVVWSTQTSVDYFAATHRGYEEFHDTLNRRHVAFVRGEYWVILDQVMTPHRGKILDWNLHTPLHMQEVASGYVSRETPGAAILFAGDEQPAPEKLKKSGPADLRGIPGEEPNREVDWLIFRKKSLAAAQKDRFGVLIYPFRDRQMLAETGSAAQPRGIEFRRLPSVESEVAIYQVKTAGYEDWLVFSDGTHRSFSEELQGDFVFGWFRYHNGRPTRFSVTGASEVDWAGVVSVRLPKKADFEREL